MYGETTTAIANAATIKREFLHRHPLGYAAASLLAGMFVGFGIVLIFSIGAPFAALSSPALKLIMGASFGIALTLVIMAGSELFTGLNMTMLMGMAGKRTTMRDLVAVWVVSYFGNLLGSLLLSWLCAMGGMLKNAAFLTFTAKVASMKMSTPSTELFFKAILCNMLVCLAVWMSFRLKEEIAKMVAIFWCLFAFIASGFEHSIANMTLLSLPLWSPEHQTLAVSWTGFARNIILVTAGNIVGGGIFVGGLYAFISPPAPKTST
jgi:nitrite transporter NirC